MKTTPLLLASLTLFGCASQEDSPPKPVVEVKVARAELADVRISVQAPAVVFPREQANIASKITAPIRRLGARKGDRVTAGQVLVRLENRDLIAQRVEALDRARGQVASAAAALNQTQKFYERRLRLFEQGAIPNRDLLVAQTELAQAKANYEVAKKFLDLLENPPREKEIQAGQGGLDAEKTRLSLLNALLEFTEIRSPFSGTITEQFLYPGDMAKPESPIFTVMDLSLAIARAQVPESEVEAIHRSQSCTFETPDHPGAKSQGRISVVNQAVDPARRTVEVWCEISNSRLTLRAGVFGSLTVITATAPKSVVVPKAAVQLIEGTHRGTVMVVGPGNLASRKEVETGEVFDRKVQIKQGLNAGELVIIEAGYGLPDGTQVRWAEMKKP